MSNFGTAAAVNVGQSLISKKGTTEQQLKAKAAAEAERLRQENEGVIDQMRERQAGELEGTATYGDREVPPGAQSFQDRNRTQRDLEIEESQRRREGESALEYMERMAVTNPDAELQGLAARERDYRDTNEYLVRESALKRLLAQGYGNGPIDPGIQRLATEFVQRYYDDYQRILAERRGEAPAGRPAQTAEERAAALSGAAGEMTKVVVADLEEKMGRPLTDAEKGAVAALQEFGFETNPETGQPLSKEEIAYYKDEIRRTLGGDDSPIAQYLITQAERAAYQDSGQQRRDHQDTARFEAFRKANPQEAQKFMDAAKAKLEEVAAAGGIGSGDIMEVTRIAGMLYSQQLRRERGLDRESRSARQSEVARSRAISAISSRHGGDPEMVRRAIKNFNSRNPDNPLRPEDFDLPATGQSVRARPGEVVEVDDIRSVNPRGVSNGSILMDPSGPYRARRLADGGIRYSAVLQDANSGFFFPDPDRFSTQSGFDGMMSRQDRVNMRQAIMQSGNSVMAQEQRRLEAAREAASSSIPEIREQGLKEVNDLERELHYRYATESASLTSPGGAGPREDIDIPASGGRSQRAEKPITFDDVRGYISDVMDPSNQDREMKKRFRDMTPEQREAEAFRILQEGRQPYVSSGGAAPQQAAPAGGSPLAGPGASAGIVGVREGSTPEEARGQIAEQDIEQFIIDSYKSGIGENPTDQTIDMQTEKIKDLLREQGLYTPQVEERLTMIGQRIKFHYSGMGSN